ncbi:MAG: TonB-dependent receptor plug domain-containing protein [Ginsengibacter sp.]
MKKGFFIAAAVFISSYGWAQQDSSVTTLDEVVVTPTKSLLKQSQTGKVVNVITREELQKSFGKSLGEVLNNQPGITINGADNNLGTNQTVYTRGASSANTLILIDGMPLYDAAGISSEFDLNNFALDNIERIEILKGAQSTLYGSDAVAGVINIITRKSSSKPLSLNVDFSAGSYQTYKEGISLSGTNGEGQTFFASYNRIYSRGFSSAYDSTGKNNFDDDGFNQDAVMLKYGLKPLKNTSVHIFAKYNSNHADLDAGAFRDDKDYTNHNTNFMAGSSIDYKLNHGFIRVQYNYNRFNRNYEDDSTDVGGFSKYQKGKYNGSSHFAEMYASLHLTDYIELLTGADFRQNSSDQLYIFLPDYGFPAVPISSDSAKTSQYSLYASLMLKKQKGLNAQIGGRYNHHNIYGSNFTYSFNPFFVFKNHYKIYASASSGYRVPSIYQLYSEYGNKNLKPEVTTSFEAGFQYFSNDINARITGFARNGKDIFYFYTDPITYANKYINADKQQDYGIETEAHFKLSPIFSANLNYTYVDGKIFTAGSAEKDTSYFNLYKRPKNVLNLSLGLQASKELCLSVKFKTASESFEPQYNGPSYKLDGYYTLGFYGQYQFKKMFTLFADLQNITDQKYFVTRGFTTKGFNVNAGAKINL